LSDAAKIALIDPPLQKLWEVWRRCLRVKIQVFIITEPAAPHAVHILWAAVAPTCAVCRGEDPGEKYTTVNAFMTKIDDDDDDDDDDNDLGVLPFLLSIQ